MAGEAHQVFATTLRRLQLESGLTQEQIADRVGCSQQTVSRWLNGLATPRSGSTRLAALEAAVGDAGQELRRALVELDDDTPPPRQVDGFSTRYHDLPPEARAEVDAFLEFQEQKHRKK